MWPRTNVLMVDIEEGFKSHSKTDRTKSKFNSGHIIVVRDLCSTLLQPQYKTRGRQIAVLTPYNGQRVRLIRQLKIAATENVELNSVVVSTIDKFQGKGADIILLDLVIRTKKSSTLGFMKNRNRLNVAISRARDVLIVIGDNNKYQRLYNRTRFAKQSKLFLEVMTDIGRNTIKWNGDKADFAEINEWDMDENVEQDSIDEDEDEELNE
jgi:hypothetical protein